ncbi:hypothetical protein ABZ622_14535 [Streptomyces sp. NPDC007164]|uniref:hypothetical protein n=1 Tax=Streptomyces sp. NPDC007164 TaxID=3156918 RepID=UPI003403DF0B
MIKYQRSRALEILMNAAMVTACATILVAIMAYWMNHQGEDRRYLKNARIDRVNSQLKELYGPLLVLTETNERAWSEYYRRYILPAGYPDENPLPGPEEARWHIWVEAVFAPTAQKMKDLITARGDLIIEGELPLVVQQFCAHAATYDALLANWGGAGARKSTLIRHPGSDFLSYVRKSYRSLKAEHELLLTEAHENGRHELDQSAR